MTYRGRAFRSGKRRRRGLFGRRAVGRFGSRMRGDRERRGQKGLGRCAISGVVDLHRGRHSRKVLQETGGNFFSIRPWRQFFGFAEVHLLVRESEKVPLDKH